MSIRTLSSYLQYFKKVPHRLFIIQLKMVDMELVHHR